MDWPIVALVAAGEMVTDAGCPGQTPNGVPSNFRPGENFLFAAAAGVEFPERRRDLGYPPCRHLVRILVSGPQREDTMRALTEVAEGLEDAPGDLLGPAPLFRLRGKHRAQLVVKTDRPREVASRAGRLLASAARAMRAADLSAVVDVDPQSV